MDSIQWKDQYSVGVEAIDIQHRGLLDIINRIIVSVNEKDDWQSTSIIIDSLINYAYNHFAVEERYMKDAEYPGLISHIALHLDFIRVVFKMSRDAQQKDVVAQQEILTFLGGWFSSHILKIDREYMQYLAAKGIK
jgi:hemerythrin